MPIVFYFTANIEKWCSLSRPCVTTSCLHLSASHIRLLSSPNPIYFSRVCPVSAQSLKVKAVPKKSHEVLSDLGSIASHDYFLLSRSRRYASSPVNGTGSWRESDRNSWGFAGSFPVNLPSFFHPSSVPFQKAAGSAGSVSRWVFRRGSWPTAAQPAARRHFNVPV